MHSDIIIIGGGIIGLAIAYRLARRGAAVSVIEAGRPGGGTTSAAAGMLCPGFELPHLSVSDRAPFHAAGMASLSAWPALRDDLLADTGQDIDLRMEGACGLVGSQSHRRQLIDLHRELSVFGRSPQWLDRAALRTHYPQLADRYDEALLLPDEGQADPRRTANALLGAINAAGVSVVESQRAVAFETSGGRLTGVRLDGGEVIPGGHVVVAAGLAARELWQEEGAAPLFAVKGQAFSLAPVPDLAGCVIRTETTYICPKAGARVVIGATEEANVEDLSTDEKQIAVLRREAAGIVPGLDPVPITERWAGLRPTTPDRLPIIGRSRRHANLVYACGHYRNGILLAPVTARMVSDMLEGEAEDPAFSPARFRPGSGPDHAFSSSG